MTAIVKRPQDTVSGLLNERKKLNNILSKANLDRGSRDIVNELKDAAQHDLMHLPNNLKPGFPEGTPESLALLQSPYAQANKLWAQMKSLAGKHASKRQHALLENLVGANDFDTTGNIIGNQIDRAAFDKLYLSKPTNASVSKHYNNLVDASGLPQDAIANAIKNEPFKNELDAKAFNKFYKSISKDQNAKNWLFSPHEQKILDKAINKKSSQFSWPIFLGSEGLAHIVGLNALGSAFPAYLMGKYGAKGISKLFSRDISPKSLESIAQRENSTPIMSQGEGKAPLALSSLLFAGGHPSDNQ